MDMNSIFEASDASVRAQIKEYLLSTKREGIENLIRFMEEESHFFTAPASINRNGAYEGGLAKHSLCVLYALMRLIPTVFDSLPAGRRPNDSQIDKLVNSATIVALLHDLCDAERFRFSADDGRIYDMKRIAATSNYGKPVMVSVGHGEQSVSIIQRFIKLTRAEAFAIRFHHGVFDDYYAGNNASRAYGKFPLALLLHMADEVAKFCMEKPKEYRSGNLRPGNTPADRPSTVAVFDYEGLSLEETHDKILAMLNGTNREGMNALMAYMENGSDYFTGATCSATSQK